jgi:hypothetical protein
MRAKRPLGKVKDSDTMSDYPLIADHGLIGNLQTVALISSDGTIDWFCAPRFTFDKMLIYVNHLRQYSEENRNHRRTDRQLPSRLRPPRTDRHSPHAEQPTPAPVSDHVNVE